MLESVALICAFASTCHSTAAAAFDALEDGRTAVLYLRPDATRGEIAHELHHYTEWLSDKRNYVERKFGWQLQPSYLQSLSRAEHTYAAEKYVYVYEQFTRNDVIFDRLTKQEQKSATSYVKRVEARLNWIKSRLGR